MRGFDNTATDVNRSSWTFLTNHAQVLLCIVRDQTVRLRDVADTVGITERAAQSIVADLVAEGYLERTRVGRRNQYVVDLDRPLRRHDNDLLSIGGLMSYLQSASRTVAYSGHFNGANGHDTSGHYN